MIRSLPILTLLAACSAPNLQAADADAVLGLSGSTTVMDSWCDKNGYTPAECAEMWTRHLEELETAAATGGGFYGKPIKTVSTAGTGTADDVDPDMEELMHQLAVQVWGEELVWLDVPSMELAATFGVPSGHELLAVTQHPAYDAEMNLLETTILFVQTNQEVYQLNGTQGSFLWTSWHTGQN